MEEEFSKSLAQGSFINFLKSVPTGNLKKFAATFSTVSAETDLFKAMNLLVKDNNEFLLFSGTPRTVFNYASAVKACAYVHSVSEVVSVDNMELKTVPFTYEVPTIPVASSVFDVTYTLSQPKLSTVIVATEKDSFFAVTINSVIRYLLAEKETLKTPFSMTLDEAALIEPNFISLSVETKVGEIAKSLFLGKGRPVVLVLNEEEFQGSVLNKAVVSVAGAVYDPKKTHSESLASLAKKLATSFKETRKKDTRTRGAFSLAESRLSEESSLKTLAKLLVKHDQTGVCVFESTDELAGVILGKQLLQFVTNFPYFDATCRGAEVYCWKVRGLFFEKLAQPLTAFPGFEKTKKENALPTLTKPPTDAVPELRKRFCAQTLALVNKELLANNRAVYFVCSESGAVHRVHFMRVLHDAMKLLREEQVEPATLWKTVERAVAPATEEVSGLDLEKTSVAEVCRVLFAHPDSNHCLVFADKSSGKRFALSPFEVVKLLFWNKDQTCISLETSKEEFSVAEKDNEHIESEESTKNLLEAMVAGQLSEVNLLNTKKRICVSDLFALVLALLEHKHALVDFEGTKHVAESVPAVLAATNPDEKEAVFLENLPVALLGCVVHHIPKVLEIDYDTHFLSLSAILKCMLANSFVSFQNGPKQEKVIWIKLRNKKLASVSAVEVLAFVCKEAEKFVGVHAKLVEFRKDTPLQLITDEASLNANTDSTVLKQAMEKDSIGALFKTLVYSKRVAASLAGNEAGAVRRELFVKLCCEHVFKGQAIPKNFLRYLVPLPKKDKQGVFAKLAPACVAAALLASLPAAKTKVLDNVRIGQLANFVVERSYMSLKPSNSLYRFCRKVSVSDTDVGVPVMAHNKRILCVLSANSALPLLPRLDRTFKLALEDTLDRRLLRMSSYNPERSRSPFSPFLAFSESEGEMLNEQRFANVTPADFLVDEFTFLEENTKMVPQLSLEKGMQNFVIIQQDWSLSKVLRLCAWNKTAVMFVVNAKKRIFGRVLLKQLLNYLFGVNSF